MTTPRPVILAALCSLAMLGAAPGQAAETDESPRACVEAQAAAGAPAADCVNRAHAACLQFEQGSAAGIACFLEAKDAWGERIRTRMEEIGAAASEEIAMIAGIEVKYDLQANLLQCDRMRELTLVRQDPDAATTHANARCEATAVGLAYVKLLLQSEKID
ncbi:hypothetical protein [Actibacterium sp. MT2.3-13A]|uniref:hypothetical protein n=1 Tax=Actibacterium sp. MT2.3-13A TaxID=2828332 RepID=UPI001BA7108F|nr:hypothetical protein [Actibacterium sp. MT2.3-13A]